ncbi:S-methyl-5'-thioadenosine phosphorylase [Candidatus Aenigmatarchaeota archaeon]
MIGIFGGTGLYSLLDEHEKKEIETPFGKPSSPVMIGKIGDIDVAFIARHGENHEIPPHKIPFKANIEAFKQLGVTHIISPAAVGSLKAKIKPGDFLIPDQFINFTHRESTFFNGPGTTHISSDEPYCPDLRSLLIKKGKEMGLNIHENGTVIVVQGPRFSSKAESNFFRTVGGDVINMTQYPELILAREKEMCYASICIVTDYDTGLKDDPNVSAVNIEEVLKIFKENNGKIKEIVSMLVKEIPEQRNCVCSKALTGASL